MAKHSAGLLLQPSGCAMHRARLPVLPLSCRKGHEWGNVYRWGLGLLWGCTPEGVCQELLRMKALGSWGSREGLVMAASRSFAVQG